MGMSKIAPFPHRYTVRLTDRKLVAPPRAPIAAGAPVEFGGTDTVWSPEQLLVAATLECVWTTFDAYARHDGLAVRAWSGTGVAVLEKGNPVPTFASITLQVEVVVATSDEERAGRLLRTAEKHCIISNALRVPITLEATITSQPQEHVG